MQLFMDSDFLVNSAIHTFNHNGLFNSVHFPTIGSVIWPLNSSEGVVV